MHRSLPYAIDSVATALGRELSVDEWAARMRIPDRKQPGCVLTGADVTRITGIERKSWDPERFADFTPIHDVVREALDAAKATVHDIDLVILATATPYYPQLNADGFAIMASLGFPDDLPPVQLQAGCAAMARAMQLVSQTAARRPLIIAYEISSRYMESRVYYDNHVHPSRDALWMSPAIFSDGAAAMVLRRVPDASGVVIYSRDSQSFGGDQGFADPLVEYAGGGGMHPPGTPASEALAVYAMNGPATKRYYQRGMLLNHRALDAVRPGYVQAVKRIYMHQASPRLVDEVRDLLQSEAGARADQLPSNARRVGNLVAPATLQLLGDDLASGAVGPGDRLCFSVVGAGPERGGFLIDVAG